MALFVKPAGGLQAGNGLYRMPRLVRLKLNTPVRMLFITDLHLRPSHPEMADKALEACKGLKPELVLLGGDLAEYDEGLEISLKVISAAFPGARFFAVPGNNDDCRLDGDRERQKQLFGQYGMEYLLNEAKRFEMNGRSIEVAGLEDAYSHKPDKSGLLTDDSGSYRILLAHEPLKDCIDPRADLILTGHTHGGQINVLGITCYLIRYESFFRFEHLAGEKRIGKTLLLVSRGIGWSKYPIRFGARSEIHYIE